MKNVRLLVSTAAICFVVQLHIASADGSLASRLLKKIVNAAEKVEEVVDVVEKETRLISSLFDAVEEANSISDTFSYTPAHQAVERIHEHVDKIDVPIFEEDSFEKISESRLLSSSQCLIVYDYLLKTVPDLEKIVAHYNAIDTDISDIASMHEKNLQQLSSINRVVDRLMQAYTEQGSPLPWAEAAAIVLGGQDRTLLDAYYLFNAEFPQIFGELTTAIEKKQLKLEIQWENAAKARSEYRNLLVKSQQNSIQCEAQNRVSVSDGRVFEGAPGKTLIIDALANSHHPLGDRINVSSFDFKVGLSLSDDGQQFVWRIPDGAKNGAVIQVNYVVEPDVVLHDEIVRHLDLSGTGTFTLKIAGEDSSKPQVAAHSGDWSVFESEMDGQKICFAGTRAVSTNPQKFSQGEELFFVSSWEDGRVIEQPSLMVGRTLSQEHTPEIVIGSQAWNMYASANEAFVSDDSDERMIVRQIKRGNTMNIKAFLNTGELVTYKFSLNGSSKALQDAAVQCGHAVAPIPDQYVDPRDTSQMTRSSVTVHNLSTRDLFLGDDCLGVDGSDGYDRLVVKCGRKIDVIAAVTYPNNPEINDCHYDWNKTAGAKISTLGTDYMHSSTLVYEWHWCNASPNCKQKLKALLPKKGGYCVYNHDVPTE